MSIRLKTSRFFICGGLLAALLLMICQSSSPLKGRAAETVATVTLTEGDGAMVRASSSAQWKKADEDMELPAGAEAKTDAKSRIELQFDDNSILRINSLTSIKIEIPGASSKLIKADNGQLYLHLKKLNSNSKFEVQTPTAIAGVRGTTFFVDVDEAGGEDSISVEDGEVEVSRGGRRVMLRQRMRARIARGGIEAPAEFDPEKMKRWEKWTEKKVAARFEQMQQEIAGQREKAKTLAENGKALILDSVRILKDMRETAMMLKKSQDRVDRLAEAADRIGDATENREKNNPGKGGRGKGGGNRPAKGKERIQKLIDEADSIESDIDAATKKFSELSGDIADVQTRAEKLHDDAAALRRNRERFAKMMQMQRRRREFDPQWKNLKGVADKISENEKGAGEQSAAVDETLTGKALENRGKGRNLVERIGEFADEIKSELGNVAETKKKLDDIRAKLNAAMD